MTSGVSRASVRSRRRWRMISWPAENPIRCVKPSMATVSPSRTRSAIASRIEATLPGLGRLAGVELDSDHQALAAHVLHQRGVALEQRPERVLDLPPADGGVRDQ